MALPPRPWRGSTDGPSRDGADGVIVQRRSPMLTTALSLCDTAGKWHHMKNVIRLQLDILMPEGPGYNDADAPPELLPALFCRPDFLPTKGLLGDAFQESRNIDAACRQRLWGLLNSISRVLRAPGFGGSVEPSREDRTARWPEPADTANCILPDSQCQAWRDDRRGMSLLKDNGRDRVRGRLKLKLGRIILGQGRKTSAFMWAHRFICWAQHGGPKRMLWADEEGEEDAPSIMAWNSIEVLHICRQVSCLHPLHMRWGTRRQNLADRER